MELKREDSQKNLMTGSEILHLTNSLVTPYSKISLLGSLLSCKFYDT